MVSSIFYTSLNGFIIQLIFISNNYHYLILLLTSRASTRFLSTGKMYNAHNISIKRLCAKKTVLVDFLNFSHSFHKMFNTISTTEFKLHGFNFCINIFLTITTQGTCVLFFMKYRQKRRKSVNEERKD